MLNKLLKIYAEFDGEKTKMTAGLGAFVTPIVTTIWGVEAGVAVGSFFAFWAGVFHRMGTAKAESASRDAEKASLEVAAVTKELAEKLAVPPTPASANAPTPPTGGTGESPAQ